MRLTSLPASRELSAHVRVIRIVETDSPVTRLLLPETGINLGFRYGGFAVELGPGEAPLPAATIAGLRRGARRMYTSAGGGSVIVNFRDGGAAAFFREPLHEFFGTTLDLASIVRASTLESVRGQLLEATSSERRVAVVEDFLRARLRDVSADRVIAAALEALRASHGNVRIERLARELGLSADRLEKRFRHRVGATPKQHASLLRLRHALDLYRPGIRLTDLALEAGYFDQAHFSREFRAFTGSSPGRLLQSQDFC